MIPATTGTSMYEACEALFQAYPLAVDMVTRDGLQSALTLALTTGKDPQFFTVHWVSNGDPVPFYTLCASDNIQGGVVFLPDGTTGERGGLSPSVAASVLRDAFPLPRDGSLRGWAPNGEVTALVAFFDDGGPNGEPTFSPMLRPDIPEAEWPPFADDPVAGPWTWGPGMVDVGSQIAGTAGQVFSVDTTAVTDCYMEVVTRDIPLADGIVLPAGWYVYDQVLRDGTHLTLGDVLDGRYELTDLGDRF